MVRWLEIVSIRMMVPASLTSEAGVRSGASSGGRKCPCGSQITVATKGSVYDSTPIDAVHRMLTAAERRFTRTMHYVSEVDILCRKADRRCSTDI